MPEVLKKVLIVEDERPMARAMELKLKSSGLEPVIAYNGEDAIGLLGKDKFSLILLDLVMPGKNGFDVLLWAKDNGVDAPVIVLSNLGQEEDRKRAKDLGAIDYLVKADTPISKIVEIVNKVLS